MDDGVGVSGSATTATRSAVFGGVLGFIVSVYVVETYIQWRQHRLFKVSAMPQSIRAVLDRTTPGAMDETKFLKSQQYSADKSVVEFVSDFLVTVFTVVFLVHNWMPWLWEQSRNILNHLGATSDHQIWQSLVFALLKYCIDYFFGLPFSLYSTFIVEERHGFNRTTLKLFIVDQLKSFVLLFAIGGPVLAAIIKLVEWGGPNFWIYLWVFLFSFSLLVMFFIFPNLILPWFYKLQPLEESPLKTAVQELCRKVNFPLSQLLVMDGSKRSGHSNAMFLGLFKNKKIVLYDTLKEKLSVDEILAVLGHEIGHYMHNHLYKNLFLSQVYILSFLFLFSKFIHNTTLYSAFGFNEQPVFIGLSLFMLVYGPVDHSFSFIINWLSRKFEYQADSYATHLGLDLRPPLVKLEEQNMSTLIWDPLYAAYHHSHPSLVERLLAIAALHPEPPITTPGPATTTITSACEPTEQAQTTETEILLVTTDDNN
ncbi:Afc1 protein [Pelomyxa schiedti]|nr:Afc1 protein [Pelomyxa schiedti]